MLIKIVQTLYLRDTCGVLHLYLFSRVAKERWRSVLAYRIVGSSIWVGRYLLKCSLSGFCHIDFVIMQGKV